MARGSSTSEWTVTTGNNTNYPLKHRVEWPKTSFKSHIKAQTRFYKAQHKKDHFCLSDTYMIKLFKRQGNNKTPIRRTVTFQEEGHGWVGEEHIGHLSRAGNVLTLRVSSRFMRVGFIVMLNTLQICHNTSFLLYALNIA